MSGRSLAACAATIALVFLAGCTGPGLSNANVVNTQNQFSIAWTLGSHTESKTYTWKNDRAWATINFGTQLTAGTLEFRMLDHANNLVCTIEFGTASNTQGVAATKTAGQPGNWRVQFNLRQFSGELRSSIVAADTQGNNTAIQCL